MRLFESFRAQRSGVEKSGFNRFLHFGPLRGPTVEMTKTQILITIGITSLITLYPKASGNVETIVDTRSTNAVIARRIC